MRDKLPDKLEDGRVPDGHYASARGDRYGAFFIWGPCGAELCILSSGEFHKTNEGWEHVSVSTQHRPPNWQEMSFVKDLFWGEDECVVQYHPPKSDHINNHPNCLHLWKPEQMPMPPKWMV